MKHKFLCLLLALGLVLGLAMTVSASGDRITSGDWVYEISEGKAVLCSYIGDDTDVVVPAKIDGYAVSEVGPGFFTAFGSVKETMKSVTLSEGIGRINTNAFKNCTALERVSIPGSVRIIGSSAFEGCTALADLELNEGLKEIQRYAFLNTGLTSVVIPASVTAIDEDSLGYTGEWGDTDQIDVFGIFGFTDTAAEEYAADWHFSFYRLEDMTDVSGRCGDDATWRFEESTGTLYIEGEDDTDPYYNGIQPWIAYADSIRRVVIGDGIFHLGDESFAYHYPNLTEVVLPESIHGIGNACFLDCTALTDMELPANLTYIYGRSFQNTGLRSITLADADDSYSTFIGGYAFGDCDELETVRFAGIAWDIDEEAFANTTVTAWYPVNDTTWNEYTKAQYGGTITWNAYDPDLFMDVAVGSFYHEPVVWAVENGITTGTSDTTFNPGGECLRAHVVTFLWRAAGSPEPVSMDNPFVDVRQSDFFYKAVLWAVEEGITNGTDATHFSPSIPCNRATVVTFLYRSLNGPAVDSAENPFTDVPAGDWFTEAVVWAVKNGITNGISATEFAPAALCSRAQIVTFLYRARDIEPAARYTFELRTNDPDSEIGFAFCEGTEFAAGESVFFYAEPMYGYLVEFSAAPECELELYYLGMFTYELVMPDHDLVLTANFVSAPGETHFITGTCENGFLFANTDYDEEGSDFAKAGEIVQLFIVPDEGFTFDPANISVTVGGEPWTEGWYLGEIVEEDPDFGTIDGIFVYEFLMPDADVSISVTCTPKTNTSAAAQVRIPVTVR